MTFHDINLFPIAPRAPHSRQLFLINDLSYLKDEGFSAIDKLKSSVLACGDSAPTPHSLALPHSLRSHTGATRFAGSKGEKSRVAAKGRVGWISKDSTTLDAQKAVRMCLDSVPMNSYIKDYWAIYDKNSDINRYKSVYYFREDLPGQIQYYVNPEMTNPFFSPLFPKNTKAFGAVYIDPMNNTHYDFRRSVQQPLDCQDECGIAEFRDSQGHREDMLANIMRFRNKNEYSPTRRAFNSMIKFKH